MMLMRIALTLAVLLANPLASATRGNIRRKLWRRSTVVALRFLILGQCLWFA